MYKFCLRFDFLTLQQVDSASCQHRFIDQGLSLNVSAQPLPRAGARQERSNCLDCQGTPSMLSDRAVAGRPQGDIELGFGDINTNKTLRGRHTNS
jgi:hypothetical protein